MVYKRVFIFAFSSGEGGPLAVDEESIFLQIPILLQIPKNLVICRFVTSSSVSAIRRANRLRFSECLHRMEKAYELRKSP